MLAMASVTYLSALCTGISAETRGAPGTVPLFNVAPIFHQPTFERSPAKAWRQYRIGAGQMQIVPQMAGCAGAGCTLSVRNVWTRGFHRDPTRCPERTRECSQERFPVGSLHTNVTVVRESHL